MTAHDQHNERTRSRDYEAPFAAVFPDGRGRNIQRTRKGAGGRALVIDECHVLAIWREVLPALAERADRERAERCFSPLGELDAAWDLALLVERVFEPRTTEREVLAWADRVDGLFWQELGFWRLPTTEELREELVPYTTAPLVRQPLVQSTIRSLRELLATSRARASDHGPAGGAA